MCSYLSFVVSTSCTCSVATRTYVETPREHTTLLIQYIQHTQASSSRQSKTSIRSQCLTTAKALSLHHVHQYLIISIQFKLGGYWCSQSNSNALRFGRGCFLKTREASHIYCKTSMPGSITPKTKQSKVTHTYHKLHTGPPIVSIRNISLVPRYGSYC